jgi:hypothetical protein
MQPIPDPPSADAQDPPSRDALGPRLPAADAGAASDTPPPGAQAPFPFTAPPPSAAAPTRDGQLTTGWGTAFWLAWAGVAGGLAAVWYSSRTLGLSTWWLGPETEPRLIVVSLLPFVAPLALAIQALLQRPWLPWLGIGGAVITALVGVGDIGRVNGYASIELLLAAGGLAVSTACFAGMLRRPGVEAAAAGLPDAAT